MTGCTKTGVKNAIEAIGQYLIDNSEKIAGDFDGMIDFNLEVSFKTNSDEANWPEIKFSNHHYLPFSEELSEKIFNAKEKEDAEDSLPDRCSKCKYFDGHSYYTDNNINISACAAGSCIKCRRNFITSDPYNEVPSWCPLKKKEK